MMFSLLLTHGRQIQVARLKSSRHREPFVRLAAMRSQPSRPWAFPCCRRISTAVNELPSRVNCLRQHDMSRCERGWMGKVPGRAISRLTTSLLNNSRARYSVVSVTWSSHKYPTSRSSSSWLCKSSIPRYFGSTKASKCRLVAHESNILFLHFLHLTESVCSAHQ